MRSPGAVLTALIVALAAGSCGRERPTAPDDTAMHITLPDPDLTLIAGASGTVRVIIVRNAFDGQITLRTEGVPSGVTVPDIIVTKDETEATMVFTATAGAAPGTSDISILADADADSVQTSMRVLHLQIRPPGSFSVTSDPISLVPGATASTTVSVIRSGGFTGTVTLSLSAPAGIVASVTPSELVDNASTSLLIIAADRSVRPGAYTLRVTATSPGFPDETFDITVTVSGT